MKKIPLNNIHEALGGKMVPFAGYLMPVRYTSDKEEHICVREKVGIFDVSHMGEFHVSGENALELIQKVSANDASTLEIGQAQYSYLPNQTGGVVDDLLVYKLANEEYMLVVNASNIDKDWDWINKHNAVGATLKNVSDNMCLFAVQGPKADDILQSLTDIDLTKIDYYHFKVGEFAGHGDTIISATGYTGAGGFELYVPNEHAEGVWNKIMEAGASEGIQAIGLGARDTLRLEMGYCLYGNDLSDDISPLEAGLSWVTKFTKDFINSENLKAEKEAGLKNRLVGFKMIDRGIPRSHYEICDENGAKIGEVTSGSLSPSLNIGIGLGLVKKGFTKSGTTVYLKIREKLVKAEVSKPPFVKKGV